MLEYYYSSLFLFLLLIIFLFFCYYDRVDRTMIDMLLYSLYIYIYMQYINRERN